MPVAIPLCVFGMSFLLVGLDFTKIHRVYKEYIFTMFCMILIGIAGTKTDETCYDAKNYVMLYNNVSYFGNFIPYISGFEPGWEMLCMAFNSLGFSYHAFFVFVSAVAVGIYRFVILKKCRNIFIALFTYISCFFFLNEIIVLRHGLASSLIFLEMYFLAENRRKSAAVCVALAFLVHTVGIFGIISLFIRNKKISEKIFLLIPFAVFVNDRFLIYFVTSISSGGNSHLLGMVGAKIGNYAHIENAGGGIRTVIVYSVPLLLTFFSLRNKYGKSAYLRECSFYVVVSAYFMLAFSSVASFARINQLFLTGNIAMSSFYLDEFRCNKNEIFVVFVFLLVNFYVFFRQNFFNSAGESIFY